MGSLLQDVRFSFRVLIRGRVVTLLAAVTLALAIAGNTTVFSLVSASTFHSWPYRDADRIVMIFQTNLTQASAPTIVSPANFVDWRARARSFDDMAASELIRSFSLTGGSQPEPVAVTRSTINLFRLLGVTPAAGRTFVAEDERPGRNAVAVVSHPFWQTRFGSDPSMIGRTIHLNDRPYEVVGILPADFELAIGDFEIAVPLPLATDNLPRDVRNLEVWARLHAEVAPAEADAEMTAVAQTLEREYPEANKSYGARVLTLKAFQALNSPGIMYPLQGALVFLVLMACANIASLQLVRAQDRQHEMAVRCALGAPRARLVRQLLIEGLLLAFAGGAAGCLLAVWGVKLLATLFAGQLPRSMTPAMDGAVLAFTFATAALAGLACGLLPSVRASTPNVAAELQEGARGGGGGARRRLVGRSLVVVEVALATMILSGAGLLIRGLGDWRRMDHGFEIDNLLTARLALPGLGAPGAGTDTDLLQRAQTEVQALPGVSAAAFASILPLGTIPPKALFTVDGRPAAGDERFNATVVSVSPGYLDAMKVPLLQGRDVTPADRADSVPVVLINDAMRRLHWPDHDPVSQRVTIRGQSREIVGVVGNVRQDRLLAPQALEPIVYFPQAQVTQPTWLLVRTEREAGDLGTAVPAAVKAADPNATVQIQTMTQVLDQRLGPYRQVSEVLIGFGALAALLAGLGIYGVTHAVSRRTREIGMRLALGAQRRDVVGLVAREAVTLTAMGFVLSLPGMVFVSRLVSSFVFGVVPPTPTTTLLAGVGLFLVAAMAAFVPARRAASLEPMEALREP